jgi:hypothetical protein
MAEKQINLRFKVTDDGTVVLDKISQSIQKVDQNVKTMSGSLSLIKWDSIVNLGQRAISAAEQVYTFSKSIAESSMNIERQAEIMGLPIENYQKLAYAARMADADTEQFATGMKFLARSIEEAKAGTGNAGQLFRALGIDVENLTEEELKLEPMIYRVSNAFNQLEKGTAKTDIAIGLMSRSGQNMIRFFNLGEEAIRALEEEGKRLGVVLDEDIIKKGSEAEDAFKRLGARVDATKISMSPFSKAMAGFFTDILDMSRDFGKWIGAGGGMDRIRALTGELGEAIPEAAKKAEIAIKRVIDPKMFADPEGIKRAKESMDSFFESYKPHLDSLKELGVVSTEFYSNQIKWSEVSFAAVKKAFEEGKISALDYGNAIKKLTDMYKGITGQDTTKKLSELEDKTDEMIKNINKDTEEGRKQLNKILDEYSKERTKILEKDPVNIRANIPVWIQEMQEMRVQAERVLGQPITIPVNASFSGGGGGISAGGSNPLDMSKWYGATGGESIEQTIKFFGEASPKKPLSETIQDIISQFGGLDEAMQQIQTSIDFTELTQQMKSYQKQLDSVADWYHYYEALHSNYPTVSLNNGPWLDPNVTKQLEEWKSEALAGINTIQMKEVLQLLQGFTGSFQFGATYVPKTGLAMVHEGEKIIPKNVSNSSVVNHFNISGGDAKNIADEIAKILEYQRSSRLRSALRR